MPLLARAPLAVVLAALLLVAVGAGHVWLLVPGSHNPRLLGAGPLRRWGRQCRSLAYRTAAGIVVAPTVWRMRRRPVLVPATGAVEVASWGSASLRRYAGKRGGEAVLLVHALVTHPWILDLHEQRSLVRALLAAGNDVWLLDWGDPGPADAGRGLNDHVHLLPVAEQVVLEQTGAPAVHLVGYCTGATVALMRLGRYPQARVASLTAVAPPVDLLTQGGMMAFLAARPVRPAWMLDGRGLVPAVIIREAFRWNRPPGARAVARWRHRDGLEREIVDAVDRWLLHHRSLAGRLLFDLVALARGNGLVSGAWDIDGAPVDLRAITAPTLAVVAHKDHLVPEPSSTALAAFTTIKLTRSARGHVGIFASGSAAADLHADTVAWVQAHRVGDPRGTESRSMVDLSQI